MIPLDVFEIDLPAGVARAISGANIVLALVGLMALSMRASRHEPGRFWLCPWSWSYRLAGDCVLAVGLLAVILAAHSESVDMRRIAIFLTVSGVVMVLSRRWSKQK